jgi:hypothetical protein
MELAEFFLEKEILDYSLCDIDLSTSLKSDLKFL